MIGDWLKRVGVLAAVLLLSSCYIPDKFKSELRLSKYGDYSLTFKGDLLWAPILDDYRKGKITPENEPEKIANIKKDLSRDIAVRKIDSRGRGRFTVEYERTGRLERVQLIALLRRDARLLAMRSMENGAIAIHANAMKPSDAQIMAEMGLNMEGEFRITTDANVVEHNATEVRPFGKAKVYIWKVENPLSPMPHLVMLREDDPGRPLNARASESN
ncbi:hypothetical protein CU669_07580 [Paramagnetospirillum kuznetsovii]|uniref:Uncharacterized protein n=1 Tax=Paramagnetospirillum kuznetsovii TaxID=2053833 RepID=A0A364NZN0_9PROT|nr:hypothetical protein [Paramagnetospirillum kuznetsovii]RAU22542.1 hypothetical protein CU669_07580 [Paramagnetospirillum kuznetsovii]